MNPQSPLLELENWKPLVGPWVNRRARSYQFKDREISHVTGPSGSGKSLLLRSFVGLEPAYGVRLATGSVVGDMRQFRRKVQFVPQFPAFEPRIAAAKAVGATSESLVRGAENILERLGFANPRASLDQPIDFASGGERLRLALLRSLLLNPQVLILDEWTASLDSVAIQSVSDLLSSWLIDDLNILRARTVASGRSIVMTAHAGTTSLGFKIPVRELAVLDT